MTPLPFNGPLFAHDFILALDRAEQASRHGRPHYNQKRWFRCLAEADSHDSARAWRAKCDAQLAQEYPTSHVRYYDHLAGSPAAKMNGKVLRLSASDPEVRTLSAIKASA
jgi:hypothetical protein